MDTGEGRFEMIPHPDDVDLEEFKGRFPKMKGIFSVGEILVIKESRFKIITISPWGMNLKLLKAKE